MLPILSNGPLLFPRGELIAFDFDPTLMQQVLYISKRKWEPDIHHYGKADNLRTGFEIAKGYWIGHGLEANFHSTVGQGGLF